MRYEFIKNKVKIQNLNPHTENSLLKDNYSPWLESQIPVTGVAESLLGDDVKTKMRPYCTSDTTDDIFDRYSVGQLIDMNYCPPWWVQSAEVMGRCKDHLYRIAKL